MLVTIKVDNVVDGRKETWIGWVVGQEVVDGKGWIRGIDGFGMDSEVKDLADEVK